MCVIFHCFHPWYQTRNLITWWPSRFSVIWKYFTCLVNQRTKARYITIIESINYEWFLIDHNIGEIIMWDRGECSDAGDYFVKILAPVCVIHGVLRNDSWWRHQMETISALLVLCEKNPQVTGGFPSHTQRPVTTNLILFFDLRLNKRLSKQSRRRWFETPSPLLSRHYNVAVLFSCVYLWIRKQHFTGVRAFLLRYQMV